MKIGTIICNHWAGENNPVKYFIYTGIKNGYGTGLYLQDGKLIELRVYKKDIEEAANFEPIGISKGFEVIKDELRTLKDDCKGVEKAWEVENETNN